MQKEKVSLSANIQKHRNLTFFFFVNPPNKELKPLVSVYDQKAGESRPCVSLCFLVGIDDSGCNAGGRSEQSSAPLTLCVHASIFSQS